MKIRWFILLLLSGLCSLFMILYNAAYLKADALIRNNFISELKLHHANCLWLEDVIEAKKLFPYDFNVSRVYADSMFYCSHDRKEAFSAAMELLSQEPFYLFGLAQMLPLAYENNEVKVFKVVADRFVHLYPWLPDGYHSLGVLAWGRGEFREARKWFLRALEVNQQYQPSIDMLNKLPVETDKASNG